MQSRLLFNFRNFGFCPKRCHCCSHHTNLYSRNLYNYNKSNDGEVFRSDILRLVKPVNGSKTMKRCKHEKKRHDHALYCLSYRNIDPVDSRNSCARGA